MTEVKSVGSELLEEIQRCGGLLQQYEQIRRMPGVYVDYAVLAITDAVNRAKKALADGDTIACIRLLEELRGCQ